MAIYKVDFVKKDLWERTFYKQNDNFFLLGPFVGKRALTTIFKCKLLQDETLDNVLHQQYNANISIKRVLEYKHLSSVVGL